MDFGDRLKALFSPLVTVYWLPLDRFDFVIGSTLAYGLLEYVSVLNEPLEELRGCEGLEGEIS